GPSALPMAQDPPTVWMLVGLQGSGKTTTAAKMAYRLLRDGKRPALVAADPYRPAAAEQLTVLGRQLGVAVLGGDGGDPPVVCIEAVAQAARSRCDVVLLDTAGRLHIDEAMMEELKAIQRAVSPAATVLVADAMTGQDAVAVVQRFHEALGVGGVVLTKLDGDARGGAALSMRAVTGAPLVYVGVGEKLEALEPFDPHRMAGRILGMGDVLSLVERAEGVLEADEAAKAQAKPLTDGFTLEDFREQLMALRQMGPLEELVALVPGMRRIQGSLGGVPTDRDLTAVEAIINSMTKMERADPKIIDGSRRRRIARGSGTTVQEVNRVLKHFGQMKAMVKDVQRLERHGRGGRGPALPWMTHR
ncbi:MAG: signal recognition particle protein, partial [Candidatus Tectimicrobiota bacterium]